MAKENKTKFALLGVLNLKPASGYDIKKFCDGSIAHFWNENYGHIYPVLKKLEEEGAVEKVTEINEGKLRNVYSITDMGRQMLVAWLRSSTEVPQPREEFLLKMFFSKDISKQEVIERLQNSKELCESYLQHYEIIVQKINEDMKNSLNEELGIQYWYTTVRYGILDIKAKIAWCEESIEFLETSLKKEVK